MINPKRPLIGIVLVAICTAGVFAQYQSTDETTANAVRVSMQAYFFTVMMSAFGQPPAGSTVEMIGEVTTITFEGLNLATLNIEDEDGYTTISGTIVGKIGENGFNMEADLTLTGGPVKSLRWSIDDYDMTGETGDGEFLIIADGKRYRMSTEDL